ncbi:chitinase domain-containing protein 1 [Iris pallida]|uniref:Chitinase domain-containing protein 1 n=1 Tax=Iris pallida TaxID=29817 RepID=A0AAX6E069_IRIPA|nr:chitinase domain-containing protein 1 [Iris pallida]
MTTRRRAHRTGASADHQPLSDNPAQAPRTGSPAGPNRHRLLLLPLFFLFLLAASFVLYRRFSASLDATSPPLSVYERGLVKTDASFQEVLTEHAKVSANRSVRHFPNPVLAYITPWNSRGYDMAKLFSSKFTHLSPVWYDLKSEGKKLVLEGRHNADLGWISELRMSGGSLLLPRVVLEAFPADLLQKKQQWTKAIDIIVAECKNMGYDGIVLESWSRWAAYGVLHDPDMRRMALQFIKQLGKALHSVNSMINANHHLELIYVIPAPRSQNLAEHDFGPLDLTELNDSVDGFSLMTYDFSGPQNPGPNAPLPWIRSCLHLLLGDNAQDGPHKHAHLIFLGINFYGNDFILSQGAGGGAITGRDYVSLLERHRPLLRWEEKSSEHFFIYSDNNVQHAVFYPSLMSISTRLDEARAWGASLSIWEIGQGLDYFFDLF